MKGANACRRAACPANPGRKIAGLTGVFWTCGIRAASAGLNCGGGVKRGGAAVGCGAGACCCRRNAFLTRGGSVRKGSIAYTPPLLTNRHTERERR